MTAGEAEEQGRGLAAVRRRELPAAVVASLAIRGASHHLATPFPFSLKETWRGVQTAEVALACQSPLHPAGLQNGCTFMTGI